MDQNKTNNTCENEQASSQYGKKGRRPRKYTQVSEKNYDSIQTNNIDYWNKGSNYETSVKFPWDDIIGYGGKPSSFLFGGTDSKSISPSLALFSGLMTIKFVPGCGYAESTNDGVNRGLAMLMAKIRASLSTSNIGFETADLGIFFTATSSIAMLIGYAKRILESRLDWKQSNYFYPRELVRAQGADYVAISNNINEYAGRLNALIDRYNGMYLLEGFDVYGRQYAMAHNVFIDEESDRGQLYMFIPDGYYVYDDTANPSTAAYTKIDVAEHGADFFPKLLGMIERSLDSWYNSSDLYQINGTLLRAFKDAPRQHIEPLYLDTRISPVQDRNFLLQIMNCTILGGVENLDITQDPTTQNYVIWKPKVAGPQVGKANVFKSSSQYLRIFEQEVTGEDNMEMTRLMNFSDPVSNELKDCGSELVLEISMYQYNATTDTETVTTLNNNVYTVDFPVDNFTSLSGLMQVVGSISPFRYIPTVHLATFTKETARLEWYGMLGDQYNWMLYPKVDWAYLQKVAYQSLWMPNSNLV